jgi:hypothetical protein
MTKPPKVEPRNYREVRHGEQKRLRLDIHIAYGDKEEKDADLVITLHPKTLKLLPMSM